MNYSRYLLAATTALFAVCASAQTILDSPELYPGEKTLYEAARKEGMVVSFDTGPTWANWSAQFAAFKKRYPEVEIVYNDLGSAATVVALEKSKNRPQADTAYYFAASAVDAANKGLTAPFKPVNFDKLPSVFRETDGRWFTIHSLTVAFLVNTKLVKNVPQSWADLLKPEYKGDIQVANPASSGTAYTMIATLVQLMGEDKAFEYLKGLHRNVGQYARSGTGPIKAVARGESAVSISFIHDAPGEKLNGFPVETVTPSEGTGAEIGSMSLIKGARNTAAAKKFYEWALTPAAQEMAAATKQFQLPSNKHAKIDPRIPDFKTIKFIDYDYAKYGTSAERRRLIARWEKEVNTLPR